ncbi:hypothetical protein FALB51S_03116 [Frigidibacter albus]|uniref:Uncharacterized protein n=1 Tax=Frigidibacter mobilis TaxID=1335048 RepID=A0A159Z307_9RHOB|nr:hypothetical protein AKL17_2200 [Frigidibacter mobilis]
MQEGRQAKNLSVVRPFDTNPVKRETTSGHDHIKPLKEREKSWARYRNVNGANDLVRVIKCSFLQIDNHARFNFFAVIASEAKTKSDDTLIFRRQTLGYQKIPHRNFICTIRRDGAFIVVVLNAGFECRHRHLQLNHY